MPEHPHVDPDPNGLEFVGAFMVDAVEDDADWAAMTSDPENLSLSIGVTLTDAVDDVWFDPSEATMLHPVLDDLDIPVLDGLDMPDDNSLDLEININTAYPYSGVSIFLFLYFLACAYFHIGLSMLVYTITWTLFLNARYVQCLRATCYCWYDCATAEISLLFLPFVLLIFYLSIFYWDTIDIFLSPAPPYSRKLSCRSRPCKPRLHWCSKTWIILSFYMVSTAETVSTFSHLSPFRPLHQMWHRLFHLDDLV